MQGLRAVAVLAVIADHLFGWPTGGFVGVDVFFVLSGFLITGILIREYEKSGRISFRDFYARRIRRILPAAMLVLVATVIAAAWLLPRGRALEAMVDAVWAALFAANWRMASVGTDYFQDGLPPSPFQHFWSLSVEEQFYFVWPVLMVGVLILAARASSSPKAPRIAVTVVLVVLTLGSLAWGLAETAHNPTVAYFSSLTRMWELGVGAILALAAPMVMRVPTRLRALMAWTGLAGIVLSVFLLDASTPFPVPGAILPVLATTLVLAAGIGNPGRGYDRALWPITNRLMGYIGNISYSLYLWHLPVIVLLIAVFPADSKKYFLACLVVTAALSIASYHWVENPIRRSNWLRPAKPGSHRKPRSRGLALVAIVVTASIVAIAAVGMARSDVPVPGASPAEPTDCFGAAALEHTKPACDIVNGSTVWPSINALEDDVAGAFDCWRPQGGALKTCDYGSTRKNALRVALIGDSHAAMLVPALRPQLGQLNWSLDTYLGYGCQWRSSDGSDCKDVMKEIQTLVTDSSKPYDLIITTASRSKNGKDSKAAVDGYVETWSEAARLGTQIIAVADNPGVSEEVLSCVARIGFDPVTSQCETPRDEATAVVDPLVQAVEQVDHAKLIDLIDYFCVGDVCPAVIGNVLVYRDAASHITGTYSTTLSKPLTSRIEKILAQQRTK